MRMSDSVIGRIIVLPLPPNDYILISWTCECEPEKKRDFADGIELEMGKLSWITQVGRRGYQSDAVRRIQPTAAHDPLPESHEPQNAYGSKGRKLVFLYRDFQKSSSPAESLILAQWTWEPWWTFNLNKQTVIK